MVSVPIHKQAELNREKFNGPILDRDKLREGTYIAIMTAIGSVILVAAVKALYAIF